MSGQGVLEGTTKKLIIEMARSDVWGFRIIVGENHCLFSTVRRFMIEQRFDPNPLTKGAVS
ncbi:MAG: hypothetical protein MK132_23525 [Lentisphaerales bacterium]|nr:hypothetical protein [Lentisphaerales bacterium]